MSGGQCVILVGQSQREFAKKLVDKAPRNAVLTITAERRSLQSNNLMWALLSDVSRSKPNGRWHTAETWKNLFLHACGHAVQFEVGLDGQPFPVGFRSSKLSKQQMTDLIEFIKFWGTEHGVKWSMEKDDERN